MQVAAEIFPVRHVCGFGRNPPDDVLPLEDGAELKLAGMTIRVEHAPGHTAGSVVFGLGEPGDTGEGSGEVPVLFSGDLLFAGSIGRCDLPGGSGAAMAESLRRVVLPRPDETVVHAGHGPSTTIARERATNPYLRDL